MNSGRTQPNSKAEHQADPLDTVEMALMLLESLADAVYVLDRQWRVLFANQAFARHMAIPQAEVVGRSIWGMIPPEQEAVHRPIFERVIHNQAAETILRDSVIRAGHVIDTRISPLHDGVAVVFRDVTRRVTAERALATSEAHLRQALEGASMGHWAWNADNDAMSFSQRALTLYGLGAEAQGMTREALRLLLIHPEDFPAVRAASDRAREHRTHYDVEYRVRHDDAWRWMRVMGGPHIVNDRIVGIHGLIQDIDARKRDSARLQAEIEEREKAQERQQLLIHELNHRVKNTLAMVQAIAAQTLSSAQTPREARAAIEARLMALAQAHDVLTRESWDGADLADIVAGAVAAHEAEANRRFNIDGPRVRLEPKTAVSMAMALHELATNAVKYGALSSGSGSVRIGWTAQTAPDGTRLTLNWSEHDGPPVTPPSRTGFGTRLISLSLAAEQGLATLSYPPEGARCDIVLLLPGL